MEDIEETTDVVAQRMRLARRMKLAAWLVPFALAVVLVDAIAGDLSLLTAVGAGLICWGCVMSYRTGAIWEQRWGRVLRNASPPPDRGHSR